MSKQSSRWLSIRVQGQEKPAYSPARCLNRASATIGWQKKGRSEFTPYDGRERDIRQRGDGQQFVRGAAEQEICDGAAGRRGATKRTFME